MGDAVAGANSPGEPLDFLEAAFTRSAERKRRRSSVFGWSRDETQGSHTGSPPDVVSQAVRQMRGATFLPSLLSRDTPVFARTAPAYECSGPRPERRTTARLGLKPSSGITVAGAGNIYEE